MDKVSIIDCIKFSVLDFSIKQEDGYVMYSYPLYSVARVMSEHNPDMKAAILALIDTSE